MVLYGRGRMLEASHGRRRKLNITGLHALGLRANKWDGNIVNETDVQKQYFHAGIVFHK